MKKICALIALCTFYITSSAFAATHSRDEVASLIDKTEKKLVSVRDRNDRESVQYEIGRIEEQLTKSRNLISKGNVNEAYYEISIGIMYFLMIDARLDYLKARGELDDTRSRLGR